MADRTLKTFDYISKGLLPLDDSLLQQEKRRWKNKYWIALRARGVGRGRSNWRSDGEAERETEEEEELDEDRRGARTARGRRLEKESPAVLSLP